MQIKHIAIQKAKGVQVLALLKNYSILAHEFARACDNYTCAAGFKFGYIDPYRDLRNNERETYRKVMQFPDSIGFIPVAIFSIGVTKRLLVCLICACLLHAGTYVLASSNRPVKK